MNEKEATKIINNAKALSGSAEVDISSLKAIGYLEAIEKAKVLAEALEHIQAEEMNMKPPFQRARKFLQKEDMVKLADEALAKWEKEK